MESRRRRRPCCWWWCCCCALQDVTDYALSTLSSCAVQRAFTHVYIRELHAAAGSEKSARGRLSFLSSFFFLFLFLFSFFFFFLLINYNVAQMTMEKCRFNSARVMKWPLDVSASASASFQGFLKIQRSQLRGCGFGMIFDFEFTGFIVKFSLRLRDTMLPNLHSVISASLMIYQT